MEWFEVVISHQKVRQQVKSLFRSTSVACDGTTIKDRSTVNIKYQRKKIAPNHPAKQDRKQKGELTKNNMKENCYKKLVSFNSFLYKL